MVSGNVLVTRRETGEEMSERTYNDVHSSNEGNWKCGWCGCLAGLKFSTHLGGVESIHAW